MSSKSKADKEALKAVQKAAAAAELEHEKKRHQRRKLAMYEDAPATVVRDVLKDFAPFAKFDRNGAELDIVFMSPEHPGFSATVASWAFDLTKANMQEKYNATPGFEWKDTQKRAEAVDSDTRYLVVQRRSDKQPVAFVSFRFLLDGPFDVLYIWELQLSTEVQRKGLGKHLMTICELIARKCGMQLVMLTVLDKNVSAVKFYREKMKYITDLSSPSMDGSDDTGYEILSKCTDAKAYAEICAKFQPMS